MSSSATASAVQDAAPPEPDLPIADPAVRPSHDELIELGNNVVQLFLVGVEVPSPTPAALAAASVGFVALFGAAALSAPTWAMPWVAASGLAAALGTVVLTGPALLIMHQFLGLNSRPRAVLAAASQGFADAGHLALGLTPLVLLLSLTSRLGMPLLLVASGAIAALTLLQTVRRLATIEATDPAATLRHKLLMVCLASGWAALAMAVSARIVVGFLLS